MIQRPRALGLFVCDQVIFEVGTGKPSLIGIFTGISCSEFPSVPRPFDVYAALTDGQGEGQFSLRVINLENELALADQSMTIAFPDPLQVVYFKFRFRQLSFPQAGFYVFELLAEDEPVCHQRIKVYLGEELP
jgi:hypothetical protein